MLQTESAIQRVVDVKSSGKGVLVEIEVCGHCLLLALEHNLVGTRHRTIHYLPLGIAVLHEHYASSFVEDVITYDVLYANAILGFEVSDDEVVVTLYVLSLILGCLDQGSRDGRTLYRR